MARVVIRYRVVFLFVRIRKNGMSWLGTSNNNGRIEASFKIFHGGSDSG